MACRQRKGPSDYKCWKSKMAEGRHFPIVKALYINEKELSDVDEIWCAEANSDKDGSHFTEIQNFRIQADGCPQFSK